MPWRPMWGVEVYSSFNFSDWWEWVVNAMPQALYPREWDLAATVHEAGGPRASLDRCRKSCSPCNSIPRPSSPYQVTILSIISQPTDLRSPVPVQTEYKIIFHMFFSRQFSSKTHVSEFRTQQTHGLASLLKLPISPENSYECCEWHINNSLHKARYSWQLSPVLPLIIQINQHNNAKHTTNLH